VSAAITVQIAARMDCRRCDWPEAGADPVGGTQDRCGLLARDHRCRRSGAHDPSRMRACCRFASSGGCGPEHHSTTGFGSRRDPRRRSRRGLRDKSPRGARASQGPDDPRIPFEFPDPLRSRRRRKTRSTCWSPRFHNPARQLNSARSGQPVSALEFGMSGNTFESWITMYRFAVPLGKDFHRLLHRRNRPCCRHDAALQPRQPL